MSFDYNRWAKSAAASLLTSDMETTDICDETPDPDKAKQAMKELIAWLAAESQNNKPQRKARQNHADS